MEDGDNAFTLPADLLKPNSNARQQLLSHIRLLHLLYHRNANQHRRSLWFRHLATFKREILRLCVDLRIDLVDGLCEVAGNRKVGRAAAKMNGVHSMKNEKHQPSNQADAAPLGTRQIRAEASRKSVARLRYWIHSDLIAKWYCAITTLTATPSFSPLSLTLLAILARILSLTGATAALIAAADKAEETNRDTEEVKMHEALERFAKEDASALFKSLDRGRGDTDVDAGVPVARGKTKALQKKKPKRSTPENAIDALFQRL